MFVIGFGNWIVFDNKFVVCRLRFGLILGMALVWFGFWFDLGLGLYGFGFALYLEFQ